MDEPTEEGAEVCETCKKVDCQCFESETDYHDKQ